MLEEPQTQYFNASLRVMQYMSGSEDHYQQVRSTSTTKAINKLIIVGLLRCPCIDVCYQSVRTHLLLGNSQNQAFGRSVRATDVLFARI